MHMNLLCDYLTTNSHKHKRLLFPRVRYYELHTGYSNSNMIPQAVVNCPTSTIFTELDI